MNAKHSKRGLLAAATLMMLAFVAASVPANAMSYENLCESATDNCDTLLRIHYSDRGDQDPQEIVDHLVNYQEVVGQLVGNGGGVNVCYSGMVVCAMAAADSHWEKVTEGKVGVMMTMGGGQSGNVFAGYANVQSTLGSGTCSFDAWSGCLVNWQDIRISCIGTYTDTDAWASVFTASATFQDPICEQK